MTTRDDEARFLAIVTADPTVHAILDRAPDLGVDDWWLTAGVLFQTVWNSLIGRPPGSGIRDGTSSTSTFFYFDEDTSWEAEDAVIRAGAVLFADLPVPVAAAVTSLVPVRRPPPPRMGTRPRRDTFVENSGPPCERHHTTCHHRLRIERDPQGRWHTYRPDGTEILVDP